MNFMLSVLMSVLPKIMSGLTPEVLREAMDAFLNIVERRAVETTNKIDDVLLLPACKVVRVTMDIPDTEPNLPRE
jgi:hypothetical protein